MRLKLRQKILLSNSQCFENKSQIARSFRQKHRRRFRARAHKPKINNENFEENRGWFTWKKRPFLLWIKKRRFLEKLQEKRRPLQSSVTGITNIWDQYDMAAAVLAVLLPNLSKLWIQLIFNTKLLEKTRSVKCLWSNVPKNISKKTELSIWRTS